MACKSIQWKRHLRQPPLYDSQFYAFSEVVAEERLLIQTAAVRNHAYLKYGKFHLQKLKIFW